LTRLVVEVEEEQQQYVPFKTITFFFPYHKYRVFQKTYQITTEMIRSMISIQLKVI